MRRPLDTKEASKERINPSTACFEAVYIGAFVNAVHDAEG